MKKYKVLSLFSGCGGMDLGFEGGYITHRKSLSDEMLKTSVSRHIDEQWVELKPTQFQTIFSNDILPFAHTVWYNYFKNRGANKNTFHVESIVELVKRHKAGTFCFPSDIDIVTGGFPCQDFSLAGKRRGFDSHKNHRGELIESSDASEETRGKLYMWMKEVIEITKPKMFVAENVKGLVNLGNVKEIIQNDFSKNGYLVFSPRVLNAADYGENTR